MNAQEAVDAGPIHHQWLPDRIQYEEQCLLCRQPLAADGNGAAEPTEAIGCAKVIVYRREERILEGGSDIRRRDGGFAVY